MYVQSNGTYACSEAERAHSLGVFYGENTLHYTYSLFLFNTIFAILLVHLVHFLLSPFKQPRVIAEMVAGFIIGPSLLGRSKLLSEMMFTNKAQFIISNIGALGSSLFSFLLGVKMDIFSISKFGPKHICIALTGGVASAATGCIVGFMTKSSMDSNLSNPFAYTAVASHLSLTSFPVVYLILKELNLLSSEIGRLSLIAALVTTVSGIIFFSVFEAISLANWAAKQAFLYAISVMTIMFFILVIVRRSLLYMIKRIPEGKQLGQTNVILLMMLVLVIGWLGDTFGVGFGNTAFWLGLAMPDGPPLGTTLSEKMETVVMEIMMPLVFFFAGLNTNWSVMALESWSALSPVVALVFSVHLVKFLATAGVSMYFKIPLKDSIVLALIMSLKGQMEVIVNIHFLSKKVLNTATFTLLYLLTICVTGIFTPLISFLYDPSRPYMVNKRRTVQHTPPGSSLRVVACVQEETDLPRLVNLLEASYPTTHSPLSIFAIHLVELLGRANPLFVDHDSPEDRIGACYIEQYRNIYNALQLYREPRTDLIELHWFTAMTVKKTMYQDVCKLALTTKASLIILPFRKDSFDFNVAGDIGKIGLPSEVSNLYINVLKNAPCSVGLLVDKPYGNVNAVVGQPAKQWPRRSVVLFLGGADSREALTYADRMAENPDMYLLVVRFLTVNGEGDDELEKKLDDGVVTWFWVKNERNERVAYREVVVRNGEETMEAIHSLKDTCNELWVVGREQGINPVIVEGWSGWSHSPELGVVGDVISAEDFGGAASVLVVQQQIMRGQVTAPAGRRGQMPLRKPLVR